MACHSQFIPARYLWSGFNPNGVNDGVFVLFKGYIDESYDGNRNIFALSCLIARGKHWQEMERVWKLHLNAKNKFLKRAGRRQISRYHASDCSGRRNEFKGWTRDERDAFVLGLFGVFKKMLLHVDVFDFQLNDLCEVFPEWQGDRLEAAYGVLTGFLMHLIGADFRELMPDIPVKITLFHDRTASDGKYDPTILRSFNSQISNPSFQYKDYFTTIAPLSWEHCIALQPADLIAFECMKQAEAKLEAREQRKSFTALVNMEALGIHSKTFDRAALEEMRRRYLEIKCQDKPV